MYDEGKKVKTVLVNLKWCSQQLNSSRINYGVCSLIGVTGIKYSHL